MIDNVKMNMKKIGSADICLSPIKREVGAKPTRSRRCNRGVFAKSHWVTGKAAKMMMLEPEDLPVFYVPGVLYER
ncbi:hypothetical protein DCCM_3461 [Desulfocucumis palustris]|uniref:Uncharacterized protein n=1 Tax=Desulfocucumis palustris TaxID=1898651 RepID=A0A2L2XDC2_9FIRM|nr:hypothetical protein DCCM_3461 [Desulfocucumis palustris]